MTAATPPAHCVVTVTSDGFALGTLVALHSFRRSNPWYAGDIAVIAGTLSTDNRDLLASCVPGIRWIDPDGALTARIDRLVVARPELADRRSRLLSLQALDVRGYDKVLFCDSDTLFTGDFAALFAMPDALIACPDSAMLRGGGRSRADFAPVAPGCAALTTFNAGMMMIDRALTEGAAYRELLALVTPESWDGVATGHTDQLLLNRALADRATLVPACYNLMLIYRALGAPGERTRIDQAAMLHFNGPAKPWNMAAMASAALRDAALLLAWRHWHEALTGALTGAHLAAIAPRP